MVCSPVTLHHSTQPVTSATMPSAAFAVVTAACTSSSTLSRRWSLTHARPVREVITTRQSCTTSGADAAIAWTARLTLHSAATHRLAGMCDGRPGERRRDGGTGGSGAAGAGVGCARLERRGTETWTRCRAALNAGPPNSNTLRPRRHGTLSSCKTAARANGRRTRRWRAHLSAAPSAAESSTHRLGLHAAVSVGPAAGAGRDLTVDLLERACREIATVEG